MKVSKFELKSRLFSHLREVSESGRELVITDFGKPVLKIIPISGSEKDPLSALKGSVSQYDDPLEPVTKGAKIRASGDPQR